MSTGQPNLDTPDTYRRIQMNEYDFTPPTELEVGSASPISRLDAIVLFRRIGGTSIRDAKHFVDTNLPGTICAQNLGDLIRAYLDHTGVPR